MSSLALGNPGGRTTRTSHLQQQKDAELQQPSYSAPAPAEPPLAAPQPKRNPAAGPPQPAMMWTPDMGIKFAPGAAPAEAKGNGKEGSGKGWDPSMGMRFG